MEPFQQQKQQIASVIGNVSRLLFRHAVTKLDVAPQAILWLIKARERQCTREEKGDKNGGETRQRKEKKRKEKQRRESRGRKNVIKKRGKEQREDTEREKRRRKNGTEGE